MALEIERRFLVNQFPKRLFDQPGESIIQGYLPNQVRVRIINSAEAYLTMKFRANHLTRHEYEYEIPLADAEEMLRIPGVVTLSKRRYRFGRFEIDIFEGNLKGLVMAEVEMASEDEKIELPSWLGKEVTNDFHYRNYSLAEKGLPKSGTEELFNEST